MSKKVFITGIAGMLGSAIAAYHQRQGHYVWGCDTYPIGGYDNHSHCDIRDYNSLRTALTYNERHRGTTYDMVYHCAAMLGVENTDKHPNTCNAINIGGTENVVQACEELGIPQLMFLSSSEVYGEGEPGILMDEYHPLGGDNVYARSKAQGELICLHSRIPHVNVCRMFNCFGPRQVKQFFIPKAIDLACRGRTIYVYAGGQTQRSYLFSMEAAQMVADVAHNAADREVVNVSADERVTLLDVVKTIKLAGNFRAIDCKPIEQDYEDRSVSRDIRFRIADTTKLKTLTKCIPHPLYISMVAMMRNRNTLREGWDYTYEAEGL